MIQLKCDSSILNTLLLGNGIWCKAHAKRVFMPNRKNTQMSLKVKREAKNGHVKTKLQFYGEDILG